jgi:hypothetical protein
MEILDLITGVMSTKDAAIGVQMALQHFRLASIGIKTSILKSK